MSVVLALAMITLGALAWLGQLITWLAPGTAVRWGLSEPEDAVEPVFWGDVRGEAAWDSVTLWAVPIAGVLLLADADGWAPFGLAGGAIYVYFSGRGIATRRELLRRGHRIGTHANVRVGLTMLAIWGLLGIVAIVASTIELT